MDASASTRMTRRTFVTGTSGAALALAAASVSRNAAFADEADEASAAAVISADEVGSDADDGASPIAPLDPPAAWDVEADIVVVGTGGGGLSATLLAAQNGAKVVTLEKLSEVGGNTKEASYFLCPGGSRFQTENGIPFDPDTVINTYWPMYRDSVNVKLMQAIVKRGYITIDWLEEVGVPWDFDWTFTGRDGTGLCYKGSDDDGLTVRMTKPVCDLVYEKALEAGADVRLSTEVTGIVMDGDAVVGVRAEGEDGEAYYVHAAAGVILCAGSGEANRDFLKVYSPSFARNCGASMTYPTNDGKIVRMGFGCGADVAGWDSFALFDGGADWEQFGNSWCQSLYAGWPALIRAPWLRLNKRGERTPYFDNNGAGGNMAATYQGMVEMSQPGNRTYVVWGPGWEENVPKFDQNGCRRPMTPDMADIERAPEATAPHNWIDGANLAIESGWIKQADTIEGLAGELGLEPDLLQKAVDEWNAACEAGEDDPLYHYNPEFLIPLEEGPFYGVAVGGYSPSCGCGLSVDDEMRVIGVNGKPIEGLYASFLTAGGGWGESGYGLASPLAVNHLSWWSGYVAAETALGLEKRS